MDVDAYYAPGLAPGEVSDLLLRAGYAAPAEMIDWYGWRNGLLGDNRDVEGAPSSFQLPSCQVAIEDSRSRAKLAADLNEYGDVPGRWRDTWFALAEDGAGTVLVADVSAQSPTCLVHGFNWDTPEDIDTVRVSSMTHMVQRWVEWFDLGLWTWDAARGRWQSTYAEIPLEIRLSGIL